MFRMKLVDYLGHRVDTECINSTSEKLKAISDVETPGDVKQLRSYLGLIHYYAKFVLRICIVLRPIHQVVMEARMWKSEYSRM